MNTSLIFTALDQEESALREANAARVPFSRISLDGSGHLFRCDPQTGEWIYCAA